MFLSKYDDIGEQIQREIFNAKYLTTPLAVIDMKIGVFEYKFVYIFGLRIAIISA